MKRKQGFTLIEVLVTFAIFSILLPAALMLCLHLSGAAKGGSEHADTIGEARYFQQFFVQRVNASRSYRILDSGDKVILSLYSSTSNSWSAAVLAFSEADHRLIYYPPESPSRGRVLSRNVYRNNKRPIFTAENSCLRCDLYLGPYAPTESVKTAGIYRGEGTFLNLMAAPRNPGRIDE